MSLPPEGPSGFRPGQRVRCVRPDVWMDRTGASSPGPFFAKVCTVEFDYPAYGAVYLALTEFPFHSDGGRGLFRCDQFEPLEEYELFRLRQIAARPGRSREVSSWRL